MARPRDTHPDVFHLPATLRNYLACSYSSKNLLGYESRLLSYANEVPVLDVLSAPPSARLNLTILVVMYIVKKNGKLMLVLLEELMMACTILGLMILDCDRELA